VGLRDAGVWADHNLESGVYPLPSSVPAHVWLFATYENPYVAERRETSGQVYGVSDTARVPLRDR
jgi:hypothetical protein